MSACQPTNARACHHEFRPLFPANHELQALNNQYPMESNTVSRAKANRLEHKRKYPQLDTMSQQTTDPLTLTPRPPQAPPIMCQPTTGQGSRGHEHGQTRTLESLDISDFTVTPSQSHPRSNNNHPTGSLSQHGGSLNLADRRKATLSQISRRFALPPSAPRFGGQAWALQQHHPTLAPVSSSVPQLPTKMQAPATQQLGSFGNQPSLATTAALSTPRGRTTSELAKTIVVPAMTTVSAHQGRKKIKFHPPVARGGYADRFLQYYDKASSEHRTWANTYVRQVKVFGTSAPEVTVEIVELFRDHNILLSKCRVITPRSAAEGLSPSSERPAENMNVIPESPLFEPLDGGSSSRTTAHRERDNTIELASEDITVANNDQPLVERAKQDERPLTFECIEDSIDHGSKPLPGVHNADDSIAGLHTDLERMAFLLSSQGSEMSTQPLARRRMLEELEYFNPAMVSSQTASGTSRTISNIPFKSIKEVAMPSSQGSDDGFTDINQDWYDARHRRQQRGTSTPPTDTHATEPDRASPELLSEPSHSTQANEEGEPTVIKPTPSLNTTDVSLDETRWRKQSDDGVIHLPQGPGCEGSWVKAFSSAPFPRSATIESISSGSLSPQPSACLPEVSKESHHLHPGVEMQEANNVRYIQVLFSNAFHWSTLSAMDRVEIHAPFREIQIKREACCQSIWVAERFRIVNT